MFSGYKTKEGPKMDMLRRLVRAYGVLPKLYIVFALALLCITASAPAYAAADGKSDGMATRLRLEVSGYRAFDGGQANGDYYISGAVELEMPVVQHASLGLRVLPLFLYPDKGDSADIYGIAAGVGGRLYTSPENRGLFFEAGAAALWSLDEFRLKSSRVGFLGDCGIGYEFKCGVHVSVKAEHISDTGIGDVEGGTNGLGLATGFSF
jgi:hypothetical protein